MAHKSLLQEQDNRIKQARAQLVQVNQNIETKNFKVTKPDGTAIETSLKNAEAEATAAQTNLTDFHRKKTEVVNNAKTQAVNTLTNSAAATTKYITEKQGSIFERSLGAMTGENHHVAEAATKKFRSKNSNAEKFREIVKEVNGDGEAHKKAESGGEEH